MKGGKKRLQNDKGRQERGKNGVGEDEGAEGKAEELREIQSKKKKKKREGNEIRKSLERL